MIKSKAFKFAIVFTENNLQAGEIFTAYFSKDYGWNVIFDNGYDIDLETALEDRYPKENIKGVNMMFEAFCIKWTSLNAGDKKFLDILKQQNAGYSVSTKNKDFPLLEKLHFLGFLKKEIFRTNINILRDNNFIYYPKN